jgi:predicted O-linked N-acetylglucosamine transferase (SPINDLY family)
MTTPGELLASASQHYQAGQRDLAIDCLKEALRLNPTIAEAHNNLGIVLAREGRLEEAVASFQEAVRRKPDYADAHSNLGNACREQGDLETAVTHLREGLRLRPDHVEAHYNLGIALLAQQKLSDAISSMEKAIRLKPDHVEALINIGNALHCQGHAAEAITFLERALRLNPQHAGAHHMLGVALNAQGRTDEAVAHYREALRLRPDFPEAFSDLGNALQAQGNVTEGEASLRHVIRLKPDSAEAFYNLALLLSKQRRLEEAAASYEQVLRLKPDYVKAYVNLANIYKDQAQLDEALQVYRAALQVKPEDNHIHSGLIVALLYHAASDARSFFEECRRWNQQHAGPLKKLIRPHDNLRDVERRLRIGYVSGDFREHVDSLFTVPLLTMHDSRQVEIWCYSDVQRPDALTDRLRSHAQVWRNIVGLGDEQVAELVRKDHIDILVDLELHLAWNRLPVFARKPAPVQVAWLGYPGTTGLSTIDYRLTDPYLDPPGLFDAFYSEESVRLPETFWCYDPLTNEPSVSALPALKNGFVTFGCLNNFCKVNDDCLALWAEVLKTVPGSRILLLAPFGLARRHVLARLENQGVEGGRIEFIERQPRQDYLRLYQRIDLVLDPLPCNGHTTSLDGLWMGVPPITLASKKSAFGRAGYSQLCNLGLKELAAEGHEQYVAQAAGLANDLRRLEELRGTLRERMQQSPLMDARRFARHVEEAYRQMWQRWCRQD